MALVDAFGGENATRFFAFFLDLGLGGGDISDLPRFAILPTTPLTASIGYWGRGGRKRRKTQRVKRIAPNHVISPSWLT